jgi:LacI family transcriptional regulator
MARATLKDVAERVGLNLSTVSRVLNRPSRAKVSEATRERVLAAAAQLGYRPHATAQALAKGRVGSIGLLVPDYLDEVYMRYADGLARLFAVEGSLLVPMSTRYEAEFENRALATLSAGRADLILALRYEKDDEVAYRRTQQLGVPLVFRIPDDDLGDIPFDVVYADVTTGYRALAEHFGENGRRRVGLVGGFAALDLAAGRTAAFPVAGFLAGCAAWGGETNPAQAVPCAPSAEAACATLLERMRESPSRFDALLVQSNRLVPGVYAALRQLGLRVPQDVAVGTISDAEYCRVAEVPVTVWEQPVATICEELFRLACRRLANPAATIEQVRVHSRLIVRRSSLKPAE